MLCGAAFELGRARVAVRYCQLLEAPQAMVYGRLRQLHPTRQLAEIQLRVLAPPPSHLAERGRQAVELAIRLEPLDGGRLTHARSDRLADVCRLEVEPAVHLAAHLAHHAHVLELHHGAAGTHQRKQATDPVPVLYVDDDHSAAVVYSLIDYTSTAYNS